MVRGWVVFVSSVVNLRIVGCDNYLYVVVDEPQCPKVASPNREKMPVR